MTHEAMQLGMDGDEVPMVGTRPATPGLTRGQRAILHHIDQHGSIRSSQAGRIIHQHRPRPIRTPPGVCEHEHTARHHNAVPAAAASDRWDWHTTRERLGCCPWASSDGWEAMRRLAARGLVTRHPDKPRGTWVRPGTLE